MRSVARCLLPDGLFVLEAEVPDLRRFTDGQLVRIQEMRSDLVEFPYHIRSRCEVTPVPGSLPAPMLSRRGTKWSAVGCAILAAGALCR